MKRIKNYYSIQDCINCDATLELLQVEKEKVKCSDSKVIDIEEILHCPKCNSYFSTVGLQVKEGIISSLSFPLRQMREKEVIRIIGLTYTAVLQPRNKGAVNKYVICTKEIIEEEIHRKIALIFNTYEFFNFTKAISPSFTVKEDIEFNIVSFSVNSIFDIRNPIYITYDKVPGFQDINYLFSNVKVR